MNFIKKLVGVLLLIATQILAKIDVAMASSEENLALGRPATQSSVLSSDLYGVCNASRAVDGDKQTNFKSLSCSHTDDGPGGPNWWRVKLDRPYRVREVTVTNRCDCCASRLDYFIVGVTNSMEDPVIGAYPLCGQYPSTVALGATVTLNCDSHISAGQYVIVQQPSNGTGWLTLCEVEVYGETKNPFLIYVIAIPAICLVIIIIVVCICRRRRRESAYQATTGIHVTELYEAIRGGGRETIACNVLSTNQSQSPVGQRRQMTEIERPSNAVGQMYAKNTDNAGYPAYNDCTATAEGEKRNIYHP